MRRPAALAGSVALVAIAIAAPEAIADIGVIAVRPNVARPGQLVQVEAGAYTTFLVRMPLYLVSIAKVPLRQPT